MHMYHLCIFFRRRKDDKSGILEYFSDNNIYPKHEFKKKLEWS